MDLLVTIGRKILTTIYAILKTGRAVPAGPGPHHLREARPRRLARVLKGSLTRPKAYVY
jgi:hypothetical protein